MRDKIRTERQKQIEKAAFDLLEEYGYEGISMLKIAKRAKASNETLYRWYGDKKGLFQSLVQNNAKEISRLLFSDVDNSRPLCEMLDVLGPTLLTLLTGPRAIALNRAAAGDPTGDLGRALAKSGRGTIMPLIEKVFERTDITDDTPIGEPTNFADIYVRLLVGDLQIRRATGAIPQLSKSAILQRAKEASSLILRFMEDAEDTNFN